MNGRPMQLKALIFDVDGTLADTEETHRRAFNDAFAAHGLDWNWSKPAYAHLLRTTGGKERIAAYLDSQPLTEAQRDSWREQIAAIHATKTRFYTQSVAYGEVPLRDGVARLIEEAQNRGVVLAIASTTTFANIEALLTATLGQDARNCFAVIGAADQVQRKKPAPDVYEYVLKALQLPASACVAIEDSANGLQAAKAAGLFTIVTPSYWTRTENFETADLLLPSLGSAERPLQHFVAQLIRSTQLGVNEINEQLERRELAVRSA